MKKLWILVILIFAAVSVWGQDERDLEGMWLYSDDYFFIFLNNWYIRGYAEDIEEAGKYIYDADSGVIQFNMQLCKPIYFHLIDFHYVSKIEINDNELLMELDDEIYGFNYRTDLPAQESIAGVWRGSSLRWVVFFIHDLAIIINQDDNFLDCGFYTFDGTRGSFTTIDMGLKVEFAIIGNSLTIVVDGLF